MSQSLMQSPEDLGLNPKLFNFDQASKSFFPTFLLAQTVTNQIAVWETEVGSLSLADPLEEGMATHSSILTWRIPWTEELGAIAES